MLGVRDYRMTNTLMNFGELSKPATVLIEKIADAIGGISRPWQIRRLAQAEAEADKIRAVSQIEITEIQHRAISRFFAEEAKKQNNMESITEKALPDIKGDAQPQNIEDDWLVHFFDKCRLISDDEMQLLWARVLAGEANSPGHYSRRTVSLLSSLDKKDALLFQRLCSFGWVIGDVIPLVYDVQHATYNEQGIYFSSLTHLDDVGLISFEGLAGFRRVHQPQKLTLFYYGSPVSITFPTAENNELDLGHVLLSQAGEELAPICGSTPLPEFKKYVLEKWASKGYVVEELAARQGGATDKPAAADASA